MARRRMACIWLAAIAAATMATASGLGWTQAAAQPDRFSDVDEPVAPQAPQAPRTGEALWPAPLRQAWGQVVTEDTRGIMRNAVYTDPLGRWQLVYPQTLTELYGDSQSRARMWRYPRQPHITCGIAVMPNVFEDLGADAPVQAHAALVARRDALVARAAWEGPAPTQVRMIELPRPPGSSGTAVQAIQFDQRGRLFELLGVSREVITRNLLVSDGDDLLHAYCSAHTGQRGWVERHTPQALRLTVLAREPR